MSSRQTLGALRDNGQVLTARYSTTNLDGTVLVDFGLGAVSIETAGLYDPIPGEYVRVLRSGVITLMLGPASPRDTFAVVSTVFAAVAGVKSSVVGVRFGLGPQVVLPYLSSYFPMVDETVLVLPSYGGIVLGRATETPGETFTPSSAGSAVESYTMDFRAVDSGTFDGGWSTYEVWSHIHGVGAWFHGAQISDTIPDAARIDSVSLYAPEFYSEGDAPAIVGLHPLMGKGVSAPPVFDTVELPPGTGYRELPTRYGDLLKTGAMRGIATAHGGFHKFSGRLGEQQSAQSGVLRIRWTV